MPQLLLIAYGCPPRIDAGSIRPTGIMKYLPRFGWEVTVLTPELPPGPRPPATIIETGYSNVLDEWKAKIGLDPKSTVHEQLKLSQSANPSSRRLHTTLLEAAKWVIAYPDETKGWIRFAKETLSRVGRELRFDAVLSTYPPAPSPMIGAYARQVLNCPWIADFRDLWGQQRHWGVRRMMQPFYARLERKTLRKADALVTVSEPWALRLRERFPTKPVYTITNGFDPADFSTARPPLTKRFSITHAGYLYDGMRDPRLLFEALRELIAKGLVDRNDLEVRFYGPAEAWLFQLVEKYGLQGAVKVCGVVPRAEALQREAESQILLLLGWSDLRETGQHTGKLFEYLGSARPILALGGARGVLTETLEETRAGRHVQSAEELQQYLLAAYTEFKRTGSVSYNPDRRAIAQYTHEQMARRFAEVLNATVENRRADLSNLSCDDAVAHSLS
jgi:glycosyltransferase involved in cell wall biosynthesis